MRFPSIQKSYVPYQELGEIFPRRNETAAAISAYCRAVEKLTSTDPSGHCWDYHIVKDSAGTDEGQGSSQDNGGQGGCLSPGVSCVGSNCTVTVCANCNLRTISPLDLVFTAQPNLALSASKLESEPQGNQLEEVKVTAKPCPSQDLSLSRPSYWQRVHNDANAPSQALGGWESWLISHATTMRAGAVLSTDVFGASGVTLGSTFLSGAASITTNLGTFSGAWRWAGAVRAGAGAAVSAAWLAGTYAGAMIGNISLPGGPTITDGVSDQIDFFLNGPSGAEPSTCGP